MKVVLLCGGKGMRLQEQTATIPKPLIEIGNRPILWHVMNYYARFHFDDFILCQGYLGEKIEDYFKTIEHDWNVQFADTGAETQTGGRIKRVEHLIEGEVFFANYSDGLSDLDLNQLLRFHRAHGKLATLTAVRPRSQFGVLEMRDLQVTRFREKPRTEDWINGGFFVFNRAVLERMTDNCVLESDVLSQLAEEGELMAYRHAGRWECMDTYKDTAYLNQLWESAEAFWKG